MLHGRGRVNHMVQHMFDAEGKIEGCSLDIMETSVPSARPRKRRRHNRALREDDVETADAIIVQSVMHETEQGPVEEFTRIPTWTN
jgi:hypothetical protein